MYQPLLTTCIFFTIGVDHGVDVDSIELSLETVRELGPLGHAGFSFPVAPSRDIIRQHLHRVLNFSYSLTLDLDMI